MYIPAAFEKSEPDWLAQLIAANPLATLVTVDALQHPVANHIPLLFDRHEGAMGVLRGHLAKANEQWQRYPAGSEALAIFSGPQHYISPSWYPSKAEHGKVVPTWNYVVVHVYGTLAFTHDPAWLLANVSALTDSQESRREIPWRVSDAPPGYVDSLARSIVGVVLTITRWEGKWKVSQNRPEADRLGVVEGLERAATDSSRAMAALVRETLIR